MIKYLLVLSVVFFGIGCSDDLPTKIDINLEAFEYNPSPFVIEIAAQNLRNIPDMIIPADNPITVEGIELGRHLFYDPLLSGDSTMSCASCHMQEGTFTDNLALSEGIDGLEGRRSSMSLLNIGFYNNGLFWDGRAATLEEQALAPVEDVVEMHHLWSIVEDDLQKHPSYPKMFREAFGIKWTSEITKELATKAIAQFERSLISTDNSKYDRVLLGLAAFTDQEALGNEMFFDLNTAEVPDAQCWHCHSPPFMTNNTYANNGLDFDEDFMSFPDLGRGEVTGIIAQNGEFRIPSLRNIEYTAPYMHDGRFATLEEVLEHYTSGGQYSIGRHPLMDSIHLNSEQKLALIAFLKTLSDDNFINNPSFSNPF